MSQHLLSYLTSGQSDLQWHFAVFREVTLQPVLNKESDEREKTDYDEKHIVASVYLC
jgi:hypothetical protein